MISRFLRGSAIQFRFTNIADSFFKDNTTVSGELTSIDTIKSKQQGVILKKKRKMPKKIDVKEPQFLPPRDVVYEYERTGTFDIPRQVYQAPLKNSFKRYLQKLDYNKFMQSAAAQQEGEEQQEQQQIDELWNNQPPVKLLSKFTSKDLFFNYREPDFIATNERKNSYLPFFQRPYKVLNGNISKILENIKSHSATQLAQVYDPNFLIEVDFYAKDETVSNLFKELQQGIQKINYQEIPSVALYLAFEIRYKNDVHDIWKLLEPVISKHIHHYSPKQLIQLKYALAGTFPKVGGYKLNNQILQLVEEDLKNLTVDELMSALVAFRSVPNETFSDAVIEQLKNHQISDPDQLGNIIYSIVNNQPKKHNREINIDKNSDNKKRLALLEHYVEPLKLHIPKMSLDTLVRLALSIRLFRVPNFDDIYLYIEDSVLKQQDKLDSFQVSQLLYAFSKGNNGYSVGSAEFYQKLRPFVQKYWKEYGNLTKSRIYFAFTSHACADPKDLEQLYLPWIEKEAKNFSYSELQNVAYGLMFTNNSNKEIWKAIIQNIGYRKEIVPLANLFAIKQAQLYVAVFFPEWDLKPIDDAIFEADTHFSTLRYKDLDDQYRELQLSLKSFFNYQFEVLFDFKNLYLLNLVFNDHKVALLLQNHRYSLPNGQPRPQLLLQQQIMESNDWKAPIINYDELKQLTIEQRKEYLKKIIEESLEEQKPKFKRWEDERRKEIYRRMEGQTYYLSTPGKQEITLEEFALLERKIE